MTTSSLNPAWSYEAPDPDVGILSECWVHEDCPVPFEEMSSEPIADAEVVREWHTGEGVNRIQHLLVVVGPCATCGAAFAFEDTESDPDIPELEGMW